MLSMYTGTPGSGKSYHMADRIYNALRLHDINIIANFPLDLDNCSLTRLGWLKQQISYRTRGRVKFARYGHVELKGRYYYWPDDEFSVEALVAFAKAHHVRKYGRDADKPQTLVFIDEAGVVFNARAYSAQGRTEWTKFFALHRHYRYDFVLGCQFDRQIDRQIRSCVEYEYRHRKVKNFKFLGWLLATLSGGNLFLVYESWYATRDKTGMGNELIRFSSRVASIYDTFGSFMDDDPTEAAQEPEEAGTDSPPDAEDAERIGMGAGGPPSQPDAAEAPDGLIVRLRRRLLSFFIRRCVRGVDQEEEDADTAVFARLLGKGEDDVTG